LQVLPGAALDDSGAGAADVVGTAAELAGGEAGATGAVEVSGEESGLGGGVEELGGGEGAADVVGGAEDGGAGMLGGAEDVAGVVTTAGGVGAAAGSPLPDEVDVQLASVSAPARQAPANAAMRVLVREGEGRGAPVTNRSAGRWNRGGCAASAVAAR
jgi:hypothetical protein